MVYATELDKITIDNFYKKTLLFIEIVKELPNDLKIYIWKEFVGLPNLSSQSHDYIWKWMRKNGLEYKIKVCHCS